MVANLDVRAQPSRGHLWMQRWQAAQAIQSRSSSSIANGRGIYLVLAIALLAAAVVLHNMLRFVERNAVLATRQPLFLPLTLMVDVVSIYLAMTAAIAAARERECGTYQVLLFGPVDESAFIAGHFLAQLMVYLGVGLLVLVWSNLVTWLLHLAFSVQVIVLLAASVATVAAVIAFGLFIAAWGGRTRLALVYFTVIVLLFVALQVGNDLVSSLALAHSPAENDPIFLIRDALVMVNNVVQWVSPYGQLSRIADDLLNGNALSILLHLGVTLAQGLAFFVAAIAILKRKGARG